MPTPTIIQGYPAGLSRVLLWFSDASGNTLGNVSSATNGAGQGAFVLPNVTSTNVASIPLENLQIKGGDAIRAIAQFGNAKTNSFQIMSSDISTDLISAVSKAGVNQTSSSATVTSFNPSLTNAAVMVVALQQRLISTTSPNYWITRIFPNCAVRIHMGTATYQASSETVIDVTPNFSVLDNLTSQTLATGWGLSLQDGVSDEYQYISQGDASAPPAPIHVARFTGDGTTTTFQLPYQPSNTSVTLHASTNRIWIAGVETAPTSVTSNGLITFAAAPAPAAACAIVYETNYVPHT